MKCKHVRKLMSPYLDDELPLQEKEEFEAHLKDCASCRQALTADRTLQRLFATTRKYPAPYGFATRVMANLEEKEGSWLGKPSSIRLVFLRAAQVAFPILVISMGIISGNALLTQRAPGIGQTAVAETFSLDLFQTTPPDSMSDIYITLMRPGHEE